MTPETNETLLDLIAAADRDGVYRFKVQKYVQKSLSTKRTEALREMMLSEFMSFQFMTGRIERGSKWMFDMEPASTTLPDGTIEARINLAKAMLLPGLAPRQELGEMAKLLVAAKDFFSSRPFERTSIQFTNNRDAGGRVYGALECRVSAGNGNGTGTGKTELDAESTDRLRAIVDGSTALPAFMREMALMLGKLGPWSWWHLTEEHVFSEDARPFKNHLLDKHRAQARVEIATSTSSSVISSSAVTGTATAPIEPAVTTPDPIQDSTPQPTLESPKRRPKP